MLGLTGKILFAAGVFFSLLLAPPSVAEHQAERCLDAVIEALFEADETGEVDGILIFRRLEMSLQHLTKSERLLLVKETLGRMETEVDGWTFIERPYKGGFLWAGPTGNLRWLREDGAWMRSYLPAGYWKNRDQSDQNLPHKRQLDRLDWEQLVSPPK